LRLFHKLALILCVVALAPLAVFALFGLGRTDAALRERIEAEQGRLAEHAAALATSRVRSVLRSLSLYSTYATFGSASPEVLTGVLRVAYRQSDDISIVSLIDERGESLVASVYLEDPESTTSLRRHPAVSEADLEEHGRRVPLDAALASGAAIGPPYGAPERPRVAMAVELPERREGQRLLLVAEVSLETLVDALDGLGRDEEQVVLIGPDGEAIGADEGDVLLPGPPASEGLPRAAAVGALRLDGQRHLGAYAPVPVPGWGLLVRQPEATALGPTARLRRQGVYWALIGLVTALLLAFLVARDLAGRIGELGQHAEGLARGELDRRVPVRSSDELGLLAKSFNRMSKDIQSKRDQIEKKNAEIREWNEQLEARVDEKTDELARAQEVVLRSRRLAGLGVLGAGVAHEINNPLASALGFIQLVKLDKELGDKHLNSLAEAETAALRIRAIVQDLLKLADSQSNPLRGPISPNGVVRRALSMVAGAVEDADVELEVHLGENLPKVEGDQKQLTEVALHLLRNSLNAFDKPGYLSVRTAAPGGQVVTLEVVDTGRGIPEDLIDRVFDPFFTTKEDWEGRGLGLSVVHKIVEDHGGRLDISSEVGQGTTVTVTLPSAAGGRHLK